MPTLDKIEAVLLTLAFIVPGFIIYSVLSLFTARKNETKEILFLRFLSFSTLNLIICLLPIRALVLGKYLVNHPFRAFACLFLVTIISPLFLGWVLAALDKHQVISRLLRSRLFRTRLLRWLDIAPMHPTPSAWDWKFNDISNTGGRWVIVQLKDGGEVLGQFTAGAIASSDPTERDLYVNVVYTKDEQGTWIQRDRSDGMLIRADIIHSVEFMHNVIDPPEPVEVTMHEGDDPFADGNTDYTTATITSKEQPDARPEEAYSTPGSEQDDPNRPRRIRTQAEAIRLSRRRQARRRPYTNEHLSARK